MTGRPTSWTLLAGLAWLFAGCIVVQVFLAGLALLNFGGNGDFSLHAEFGYTGVGLLALAVVLTAVAAGVDRRGTAISFGMLVLYFVQTALPALWPLLPAMAALHPVNALFLFALALWYARRAMLESPERWLVFAHVASAFVFAAGHGVSIFMAFRLRGERDPARIAGMLDLSGYALIVAGVGLLALLGTGIAAGWLLGSFGRWWIWIALGLLIVVGGLMTPIGATYYNSVRRAIGQRGGLKKDEPDPVPVAPEELARLLDSRRPDALLLLGGGGFLAILWLMMFRPF
jgi:hypothetical protein